MRPLIVVYSPRAERHIEAAERWWRENRETSDAIRDEIRRFAIDLADFPYMGQAAENMLTPGIRRWYLFRINHHLYYRVEEKKGRIVLAALWHASRRPRRF